MAVLKSDLVFTPPINEFISSRLGSSYTAFCGGNNSGKSLVLKNMKLRLGRVAYMAGPQRFYHVYELSTQRFNASDYDSWDNTFSSQFANEDFNYEQNYIDLGRIIGGLKDTKRKSLFDLCGELIGSKFSLKRHDESNELSPRYVDMDGQNLSVGSTGTRLLMTILGLCMDEQFTVMLIDEPELGLSPRVQTALAGFLVDVERRRKYFPHLSGIFVSTHSHIFLDRTNVGNNFIVKKDSLDIEIKQIESFSELHELQFNMLGNSLESLFLPSAIVICEGKTDKPYIERLVQLRHPSKNILVIEDQGDVQRSFRNFCRSVGDIYKSPFRDRVFIVLDSVHSAGTVETLKSLGANPSNIITWDRNGIEYIYPEDIVARSFSCDKESLSSLQTSGDNLMLNGITRRKVELSEQVVKELGLHTNLPEELVSKLLRPLAAAIGEPEPPNAHIKPE